MPHSRISPFFSSCENNVSTASLSSTVHTALIIGGNDEANARILIYVILKISHEISKLSLKLHGSHFMSLAEVTLSLGSISTHYYAGNIKFLCMLCQKSGCKVGHVITAEIR